jgi:RimJ/RimL family protein N-acetyltransferase
MNKYVTKDGRAYVIRRPVEGDAANIIQYSKEVFASTDQVLTMPEEYTITVENEIAWINNFNLNADALALVAEWEGKIIGLLFFMPNTKKKNCHTGEFGVNVHPHFQAVGVGRRLIESLLQWARDNSRIEKVYLHVFATNQPAIKLYRSLGFVEEGRHINAIKQSNGIYVDVLQMYVMTGNA